MKIDIEWVKSAQSALCQLGVVSTEGYCPDEFNGYVSSLSVAIAQMGLVPALLVYERDIVDWVDLEKEKNEEKRKKEIAKIKSSDAENNRGYVIHAIESILVEQKILTKPTDKYYFLSSYLIGKGIRYQDDMLRAIQRALVALKLALRFYKEKKNVKLKKTIAEKINSDNSKKISVDVSYLNTPNANIGYLFYRDLYRYENKNCEFKNGTKTDYLKNRISAICNVTLGKNTNIDTLSHNTFPLKTTYPGLLIGSGLSHGLSDEGDIKLGFAFDHISGMPYIPGSSIKGVLRSVFPKNGNETGKIEYLNTLLGNKNWDFEKYSILEKKLFEAKGNDMLIYFDAFILESKNKDGRFLGNDYITPHKDAFSNPVPLQFLKVLPNVVFQFQFRIPPQFFYEKLTCKNIEDLFKQILLDLGVGAKTNVGYGHFIEYKNSQSQN